MRVRSKLFISNNPLLLSQRKPKKANLSALKEENNIQVN